MGDSGPRACVLVINDNQAMLDLLRDLLREAGYDVRTSLQTLHVDRIREIAPDIIVQDLVFGGEQDEGWQFLTMARLDPALSPIPMVLCTGAVETVTNAVMAERLDRLGVRVLLKPFDLDELLAAVAESLAAQKLLDQARDA